MEEMNESWHILAPLSAVDNKVTKSATVKNSLDPKCDRRTVFENPLKILILQLHAWWKSMKIIDPDILIFRQKNSQIEVTAS